MKFLIIIFVGILYFQGWQSDASTKEKMDKLKCTETAGEVAGHGGEHCEGTCMVQYVRSICLILTGEKKCICDINRGFVRDKIRKKCIHVSQCKKDFYDFSVLELHD